GIPKGNALRLTAGNRPDGRNEIVLFPYMNDVHMHLHEGGSGQAAVVATLSGVISSTRPDYSLSHCADTWSCSNGCSSTYAEHGGHGQEWKPWDGSRVDCWLGAAGRGRHPSRRPSCDKFGRCLVPA